MSAFVCVFARVGGGVLLSMLPKIATPPACYRGLSGSVPESVPENRGVSGSVPRSVSGALRALGSGVSKKCPESHSESHSERCSGHSPSRDTFWTLRSPRGPRDTPWDTPGDTPVFGDTPGDTSGLLQGPRDPCSRPGGGVATQKIVGLQQDPVKLLLTD